jgi:thiol-disulfide isomerase/thioredoxin
MYCKVNLKKNNTSIKPKKLLKPNKTGVFIYFVHILLCVYAKNPVFSHFLEIRNWKKTRSNSMDQIQRAMVSSSRNFKTYFDIAYTNGCKYLSTFACNPTTSAHIKPDILCSTANTRQRSLVEVANKNAANTSPVQQKRSFSTTSAMLSNIFNVQDDKDFKARVLDSKKPVIVDFYATWCGPCKILAPKLEKFLAIYSDKAEFAKVDIDKLADLAFDYNV